MKRPDTRGRSPWTGIDDGYVVDDDDDTASRGFIETVVLNSPSSTVRFSSSVSSVYSTVFLKCARYSFDYRKEEKKRDKERCRKREKERCITRRIFCK